MFEIKFSFFLYVKIFYIINNIINKKNLKIIGLDYTKERFDLISIVLE